MLAALKIQNYALIRELDINFHEGLNIITGETGTGKSIMLGALGLILGNRADTDALMNPDQKCIIEGRFDMPEQQFQSFFRDNDLDWDITILIRREISPGGKSRAFINDTPVNLNVLKEFGEKLVDIHSQNQTRELSDAGFQLLLLDALAGHKKAMQQYAAQYTQYRKLGKELEYLKEKEVQTKKEYDYLVFQLDELDKANIHYHELEELEEELGLLSNTENIKTILQSAIYDIDDSDISINTRLADLRKQFAAVATLNPKLKSIHKRLEDILIETKDIAGEMTDLQDSTNADPERLAQVNDRLRLINHIVTKHQFRSETEIVNFTDELREKVSSANSLSSEIAAIEKQLAGLFTDLNTLAAQISQNRQAQAAPLEKELITLLKQVGIPEASIQIVLQDTGHLRESGKDGIQILFSANRGAKPQEVGSIASGGELSRLMLCFKYILADSILLPTVIFDEIDSGVSGEVAIRVGQIIKKLSAGRQVLCITHLPQVAANGDHHYIVYKIAGEDRTVTHIRQLADDERIEEIAKMIGGHTPGTAAVESAKELLMRN